MNAKSNVLVVVFLSLVISINAQIFSGGIMAGVSTGSVKVQNIGTQFTDVLQGNKIYGFETGIFAKLMISPFYIKPMALYNFSMGDVNGSSQTNSTQSNNFTMHRMEVPVLFGLKIIGPLSIEAGPVYNYIIQSNSNLDDNTISISQSAGIGYRVGVALEISKLLMNISYGGVTVNSNGFNHATFIEPYKIVFGLGVKLGKKSEAKSK